MKKISMRVIILWAFAVAFLIASFSCIAICDMQGFATSIVIAVILGLVGWEKHNKGGFFSTCFLKAMMLAHPVPKATIANPVYHDYNLKEYENEIVNDTVTISAQKLPTLKALKEFHNYVVIDFETTGLSAKTDKAVEVACLKVVDGEVSECQTLIDPKIQIPPYITRINGITDGDVAGKPSIAEVAKFLYEFCDGLPFVAHNAPFDMGFLKQAYIEIGIETNLMYVDTLRLARTAFPEYNTHKLEFLINELGLAEKQTHRAMDDVRCTKKLLDICISKMIEQKEIAKLSKKHAATISE